MKTKDIDAVWLELERNGTHISKGEVVNLCLAVLEALGTIYGDEEHLGQVAEDAEFDHDED